MQVAGRERNYRLVLIPSPILKDKGNQIYIRWAIFHTHYCCVQKFTGSDIVEGGKRLGECTKRLYKEKVFLGLTLMKGRKANDKSGRISKL